MAGDWIAALSVVVFSLGAYLGNAWVLWARRGGRVWALLTLINLFDLTRTLCWLGMICLWPERYHGAPVLMWGVLVAEACRGLVQWRLSFRVVRGG